MPKVFISYRHGDSTLPTKIIYNRLKDKFGEKNVFLDRDPAQKNIPVGYGWRESILTSLKESDVLLIIIGRSWEKTIQEKYKNKQEDLVLEEVKLGLSTDSIFVVPIILPDVEIPNNLPNSISGLTDIQCLILEPNEKEETWYQNIIKVIEQKEEYFSPENIEIGAKLARDVGVITSICLLWKELSVIEKVATVTSTLLFAIFVITLIVFITSTNEEPQNILPTEHPTPELSLSDNTIMESVESQENVALLSTFTPTSTSTFTGTPTLTPTYTSSPTPTSTSTPSPSATFTPVTPGVLFVSPVPDQFTRIGAPPVNLQIIVDNPNSLSLVYSEDPSAPLPQVLRVDSSTGLIRGTVNTIGTYNIRINVRGSGQPPYRGYVSFQWTVAAEITASETPTPTTATGGQPPVSVSLTPTPTPENRVTLGSEASFVFAGENFPGSTICGGNLATHNIYALAWQNVNGEERRYRFIVNTDATSILHEYRLDDEDPWTDLTYTTSQSGGAFFQSQINQGALPSGHNYYTVIDDVQM